MLLAILSDVHGNLPALEAVLADLRARAPDLVVNLGDCATAPLWPRETMELLETLRLPTVRGNHDRWIAERPRGELSGSMAFTHDALTPAQRAALGALPATIELAEAILAVHGTPASDTEYLLEEAVDERMCRVTSATLGARLGAHGGSLVLCGHSHTQHMAHAGGRLVLNPGSVGCPRAADNAQPWRNEASSPHARYALATKRGRGWTIEMLALEYDWSVVVARAQSVGRADWAAAFLGEWE